MGILYHREIENRMSDLEKRTPYWISPLGIVMLAFIWELICLNGFVSELYLPQPTSIIKASVDLIGSGELLINVKASLWRVGVGFLAGSSAGIVIGLMLGFSKLAESVGNPIIYSLYPIPKIALLPLIILWLGIGELSKVTIISLGVFFPVVISTYSGVKHVDPLLLKVAVSFHTTRTNILRKVILPATLPMIFAGLKLAASTSLLLLVAAEMIAAKEGIGAMILHYSDLMLTTKLMVGVLTLSLIGLVFNQMINQLERRIVFWK